MKKLGIIGCGWLGARLATALKDDFEIFTTTTSQNKKEDLEKKGYHVELAIFPDDQMNPEITPADFIQQMDAVIITVPFSERRGTRESLKFKAENLCAFIGNYSGQIFFTSSTGVYPEISKVFREEDLPVNEVFSEQIFSEKYPQINILRLAGLMGDNRLLKNYSIKNPEMTVNHIHYSDITHVIKLMLKNKITHKLYNIVAPNHPTKAEVIAAQNNASAPSIYHSSEDRGKEISSAKVTAELDYTFLHPDPRLFHL